RIVLRCQHEAFQTCLIFDSAQAIQKCAVTPMFGRIYGPGARSIPPAQAGELKTHQISCHQSSSKPFARESKCSAKPSLYLFLTHGPDDIEAAGITRAKLGGNDRQSDRARSSRLALVQSIGRSCPASYRCSVNRRTSPCHAGDSSLV